MNDERRTAAAGAALHIVDPRSPDAIASMTKYFVELGAAFPTGFDPGDTLVVDAAEFDPPAGAFVVIRVGSGADIEVAGCGGVRTLDEGIAEIKRMWIAPSWRGVGLASRLLADLERRAVEMGHETVRLDTNASLTTAITMYERAGYRAIGRYNDNPYAQCWFEKRIA